MSGTVLAIACGLGWLTLFGVSVMIGEAIKGLRKPHAIFEAQVATDMTSRVLYRFSPQGGDLRPLDTDSRSLPAEDPRSFQRDEVWLTLSVLSMAAAFLLLAVIVAVTVGVG